MPVNDYPEINFSMLTNPLTLSQALVIFVFLPRAIACSFEAAMADVAFSTNNNLPLIIFHLKTKD